MTIERFRYSSGVDVESLSHIALMKFWMPRNKLPDLLSQLGSKRGTSIGSAANRWTSICLIRKIMEFTQTILIRDLAKPHTNFWNRTLVRSHIRPSDNDGLNFTHHRNDYKRSTTIKIFDS